MEAFHASASSANMSPSEFFRALVDGKNIRPQPYAHLVSELVKIGLVLRAIASNGDSEPGPEYEAALEDLAGVLRLVTVQLEKHRSR